MPFKSGKERRLGVQTHIKPKLHQRLSFPLSLSLVTTSKSCLAGGRKRFTLIQKAHKSHFVLLVLEEHDQQVCVGRRLQRWFLDKLPILLSSAEH